MFQSKNIDYGIKLIIFEGHVCDIANDIVEINGGECFADSDCGHFGTPINKSEISGRRIEFQIPVGASTGFQCFALHEFEQGALVSIDV